MRVAAKARVKVEAIKGERAVREYPYQTELAAPRS
jgi:hypothetical protein